MAQGLRRVVADLLEAHQTRQHSAAALDPGRLFFLAIIVPVILIFFTVQGLFSGWSYRATRHPFVAAAGNAIVLACAIAVTFPMIAR